MSAVVSGGTYAPKRKPWQSARESTRASTGPRGFGPFEKVGATHIIWVPAPQIADDDIRRVEADLIEALNPTANQVRPAPPKKLQDDTTRIFEAFRRSIHEARRSKFFIEVKS